MSVDLVIHAQEFRGRLVPGYMSVASQARLGALIDDYGVQSVIEVGSFQGMSACWFAERVDTVICIDHFDMDQALTMASAPRDVDIYRRFIENTIAYPNIRSIRLASLDAASLDIEADMVYVDAGHTYEEVVADIVAWRPHARKVICGDDNGDPRFGVTAALSEMGIADSGERIWWQKL